MKIIDTIKKISKFPERQGFYVLSTEKIICSILQKHKIKYGKNSFVTYTPHCTANLIVDKKKIQCKGTSFVSGTIDSKAVMLSSTTPSRFNLENKNINFNPFSDAISCSNFYFAPAIAISKKDVPVVLNAEKVLGQVKVKKIRTEVSHILVGNLKNPQHIVFAHYDSISKGAIDNASGVAVALHTIIEIPEIIEKTLFVFDPCEELSFEKPTYWGYGFRVFEKKFFHLMQQAKKIIPLDCVGNGPTLKTSDPKWLHLAFPIKNFDLLKRKMVTLYGDIDNLMTVYHSEADMSHNLKEKYLRESQEMLLNILED